MSASWIAAFAVLTAAVVLLAVIMIGLLGRTLTTLRRFEAALTPSDPTFGPRKGDHVPMIPETPESAAVDLADGKSRSLVVFVEAGCEPCHVLVADLGRQRRWPGGTRRLLVADNPDMAAAGHTAGWQVHLDPSHGTAQAWSVTATPSAYVIDQHAVVRAAGHANTAAELKRMLNSIPHITMPTGPTNNTNPPERRSTHVH